MASLELRNGIWHIRWRNKRGKQCSQSTELHTSKANDKLAEKKLRAFKDDLLRGKNPSQALKITTLLDDVLSDYTVNSKKSLVMVKIRVEKHLRPWFGEMRADRCGADDWREYVLQRQSADASNSTINLERSTLVRGFHLAFQSGRIEAVPYLPRLKNAPPRSGFIDRAELENLCRHLPEYLRPPTRFAFLTGWRLGEIRQLQWRLVDFISEEIRLEPGMTKNGEGRVFPMISELRTLLSELRALTVAVNKQTGAVGTCMVTAKVPTLTPFVFTLRGKPLGWFYASWRKAAKAIGKPGLLFHDLRRSAIIDMDRRGIPRRVIMELVGQKTAAVHDNYRRVGKADLDRARELMERSQSVGNEAKADTEA